MRKNAELEIVDVAVLTNPRTHTEREHVLLTRVPTVGEVVRLDSGRHVIVLRVAHCPGISTDCHAEVWVDNFDHTKLGDVWKS